MKKRKWLVYLIPIVIVVLFVAWVCCQELAREDASADVSKQSFSNIKYGTDVEELEVTALIESKEESASPYILFSLTNNAKGDMVIGDEEVFLKKNSNWSKRMRDGKLLDDMLYQTIYGEDTINRLSSQLENPEEMTNKLEIGRSPWNDHLIMELFGEYRMEIEIKDTDGNKLGIVWVEWMQQLKE